MAYALVMGLTILSSWSIIRITTKNRYKKYHKTLYKQSDLHKIMKKFFDRDLVSEKIEPSSQLQKHKEKNSIKVLILENQAYWVADNKFYVAEAFNGIVIPETAKPVDTNEMSKKDVDKMLFILDNLQNGKANDSGSAGDKGI